MLEELRRRRAAALEARNALIGTADTLTTTAAGENRSLTADEDTAFSDAVERATALGDELVDLDTRIGSLEAQERAIAQANQIAPPQINTGVTRSDPYAGEIRERTPRAEIRGRIERAIEGERSIPAENADRLLDLVERQDDGDVRLARHILATGQAEYRSAWGKLMSGRAETLTESERRAIAETRAASLTDNAGGYAVPFMLDPTIIDTRAGSVNPMRQIARVEQITGDNWHGITSAGVTASWDGEAGVVSDDAPTLAQPTITPHKAQVFVPYSIEIGQDWAGMENDIRMMFANAKDDLEAAGHVTGAGDGSTQPKGFVTALDGTASEVAPAVAEAFSSADVYGMEEALGDRYLPRAQWVANKKIYNLVRQFDTYGGADMWERIGAGRPAELIGYPTNQASAMDGTFNPAATADNFVLAFGDWSNYVIVDRVGLTVEYVPLLMDPTTGRPNGRRGIYGYWRTGGDVVNIAGLRLLNLATAA